MFIAILTGAVICLCIKMVVVILLDKYNFDGFYRKNPALVNVANVALECWHIFLAITFVISRGGILIFMSFLFIGRVDRTVLADDLGMMTSAIFHHFVLFPILSHLTRHFRS